MAIVTWDKIRKGSGVTLSNEDLTASINQRHTVLASEGKSTGKWYWEIHCDSSTNNTYNIGIGNPSANLSDSWGSYNSGGYYTNGSIYGLTNLSSSGASYGSSFTTGDTISVSLDVESKTLEFYKNGVPQGVINYLISGSEIYALIGRGGTTGTVVMTTNFGRTPFKYPIPNGYRAYETPLNKTLILDSGGYKKYEEGNPETLEQYGNIVPTMTSNTDPSGVVRSSGPITSAPNAAFRAFDKTANRWSVNSTKGWISYTLSQPRSINKYTITGSSETASNSPRNWTLEGSNDSTNGTNGTWDVLDTRINQTFGLGQRREYSLSGTIPPYLDYKINITANDGNSYLQINEIELIGTVIEYVPEKRPSWKTVSPNLPTLNQFQEDGMEDLSFFDRKVQQALGSPLQMTSSVLDGGKVFKFSVDLKKYFDLRKLEVK
jgi:hypothetical protein